MIWLFLTAVAVLAVCWAVFPQFRTLVDGWKSRVTGLLAVLGGVVEVIDRQLLSQALGLDQQGKAYLFIGLAVALWLFREVAKKPGALVKK